MNKFLTGDEFWDDSALDDMELLDKVAELDGEFVAIFLKSLQFANMLLDENSYQNVEHGYLELASGIAGTQLHNLDDLTTESWAGYHPVPLFFSRLHWYGVEGKFHYTDGKTPSDSHALNHEIKLAREFHDSLPPNWVPVSETDAKGVFGQVLQAVEARYALDTSRPLTVSQIVVLSGMSLRSVRNALAKNDETGLNTNEDGLISNQEAIRWLKQRRNFTFTTTYNADTSSDESEPSSEIQPYQDYVFVPVTDDGVAFLPELRRSNGYQIGKYGEEEYVDDYFTALEKLCSMDTPRWRRPNKNSGNFGIKPGSGWRRVPLKEIEEALALLD